MWSQKASRVMCHHYFPARPSKGFFPIVPERKRRQREWDEDWGYLLSLRYLFLDDIRDKRRRLLRELIRFPTSHFSSLRPSLFEWWYLSVHHFRTGRKKTFKKWCHRATRSCLLAMFGGQYSQAVCLFHFYSLDKDVPGFGTSFPCRIYGKHVLLALPFWSLPFIESLEELISSYRPLTSISLFAFLVSYLLTKPVPNYS